MKHFCNIYNKHFINYFMAPYRENGQFYESQIIRQPNRWIVFH
jgi:hypothetical protein